jgi:serine/threonine protein kinase/WD40 repeat protein
MYVFMQCVAEAVVAKGVRGLAELVPGGGFLYDIANDAHRRLRDRKRSDQIREEVIAVAAAGVEEVRRVAEEVVREVAANATPADQAVLELYLTQVPGAVRQSFRRADDPSGRSVPDQFALADPSDLARRLPSRLPQFRTGDVLPGRPGWVLGELLGTGGFGEVWLARNPSLAALKGAVKFGLDPQARERLLRHEGGLVSRVMEEGRHPNIVPLLDAYLEGDTPWLMYEYVGGGELGGLIHAWQALPQADRTTRTVAALRTLAAAVGHFHRLAPPLVHRDLKPANILVRGAGGSGAGPQLVVADFGIGGLAADAALAVEASRRSSGYLGSQLWGSHTPLYASPQQQRGEKPDPRDDVHALGVIGYQMLTGKLDTAPGADFARTLRRLAVPDGLIELLGDCAAHDPAHRPRDAAELADRLVKAGAPGAAAPSAEQAQIVPCPECGVSLRFRAGATALRCSRCSHIFNPSAAPAPKPAVVEARVAAPPPPEPETRRSGSVARADRADGRRRDRDREDDHRRDRPRRDPADERSRRRGNPTPFIVGGAVFAVVFLIIMVFALRTPRAPVAQTNPFQPVPAVARPGPNAPSPPAVNPRPPAVTPVVSPPAPQPDPVREVRTFTHAALGKADRVRYTPDGQTMYGVTPDGEVTVVSALTGTALLSYHSKIKGLRPAFFPDGQTILTGGDRDGAYLINVSTGIDKARGLVGLNEKAVVAAVSPSKQWIAAGGEGGNVVVWNVENLQAFLLRGPNGAKAHAGPVTAVAFGGAFGSELVTASGNTVRCWDDHFRRWDEPPRNVLAGGPVFWIGNGRHGDRLVAGTTAQGINLWDSGFRQTGVAVVPASGAMSSFTRVAVANSPFEAHYAALAADGRFGFWNGTPITPIVPEAGQPTATDIDFHKDTNLAAVSHTDGSVGLWCMNPKKLSVRLTNHGGEVIAAAWSPDGKELATADRTGRVRVWGAGRSGNDWNDLRNVGTAVAPVEVRAR